MKKILIVVLVLVLAISLASVLVGCGKAEPELIGFDIDLARLVAKELEVEIEFKKIEWNLKETEIQSGTIDLIWNGMTITEEREEEFAMSPGYLNNKQVAIVRKADKEKFSTKEGLTTGRVMFSAEAGSAGEEAVASLLFDKNINEIKDADIVALTASKEKYVPGSNQISILTEILAGTVDVGVMDRVLAVYYVKKGAFTDLAVIDNEEVDFGSEEYGIAAKKGSITLIDEIYSIIVKAEDSGKLAKIAKKYGLEDELTLSNFENFEKRESSDTSLKKIKDKKKLVVGYTEFAPIAYFEGAN